MAKINWARVQEIIEDVQTVLENMGGRKSTLLTEVDVYEAARLALMEQMVKPTPNRFVDHVELDRLARQKMREFDTANTAVPTKVD